jgi:SEC-C motif-containing protein
MLCPCDSKATFATCCQPIIEKHCKAQSAEQLMRSRYSAYATQNADYIFTSYANISQQEQSINEINTWAKQCKWIKLEIIDSQTDALAATVEFSAYYLQKSTLYQLHEKSRFIVENNEWRYLDGDIITHQEITKVKRNDPCPCLRRKKFKLCCGR